MSAFTTARPTGHSSASVLFSRILGGVSDWNNARVTRKTLSRLSDRELDDIGLSRSDINRIAERA